MTDVSPADLGARVVVRHALPEGGATDVLGHLRSWTDAALVIASRTGDVEVPRASVLAVKRIPERRER